MVLGLFVVLFFLLIFFSVFLGLQTESSPRGLLRGEVWGSELDDPLLGAKIAKAAEEAMKSIKAAA